MIKLICSDVDGTLVPDGGHELNPEYFDQIRRLKKAGILLFEPEKTVCSRN